MVSAASLRLLLAISVVSTASLTADDAVSGMSEPYQLTRVSDEPINLGDVLHDRGFAGRWSVINDTGDAIRLDNIFRKCGCTDVTPSAPEAPPGETFSLDVRYRPSQLGPFRSEVVLIDNGNRIPLRFFGRCVPTVGVSQNRTELGPGQSTAVVAVHINDPSLSSNGLTIEEANGEQISFNAVDSTLIYTLPDDRNECDLFVRFLREREVVETVPLRVVRHNFIRVMPPRLVVDVSNGGERTATAWLRGSNVVALLPSARLIDGTGSAIGTVKVLKSLDGLAQVLLRWVPPDPSGPVFLSIGGLQSELQQFPR